MELTQRDFDERKARVDQGTGDDEDARLVKQYEQAGYTPKSDGKAVDSPAPAKADQPEQADTAGVSDTRTGRAASRPGGNKTRDN